MIHPWPQTPHGEESIAMPETFLRLISKSHIQEVHGNLSNPFFKKKVRGQKHSREANKCRIIYAVFIFSNYTDFCYMAESVFSVM